MGLNPLTKNLWTLHPPRVSTVVSRSLFLPEKKHTHWHNLNINGWKMTKNLLKMVPVLGSINLKTIWRRPEKSAGKKPPVVREAAGHDLKTMVTSNKKPLLGFTLNTCSSFHFGLKKSQVKIQFNFGIFEDCFFNLSFFLASFSFILEAFWTQVKAEDTLGPHPDPLSTKTGRHHLPR